MPGLTLQIIGEGKCKYQILQKAPYLGMKSSNISTKMKNEMGCLLKLILPNTVMQDLEPWKKKLKDKGKTKELERI